MAELVVVDKSSVTQAPDGVLSIEEVAAMPASGIPAYYAMAMLCREMKQGAKVRHIDKPCNVSDSISRY